MKLQQATSGKLLVWQQAYLSGSSVSGSSLSLL